MLDEDSITAEYSFVNIFLSFYDKLYMIIIKYADIGKAPDRSRGL